MHQETNSCQQWIRGNNLLLIWCNDFRRGYMWPICHDHLLLDWALVVEKIPKDTIWPPHLAIYLNPQVGIPKIWNYGKLIHDKHVNNLDKGKQTTMNVLEPIVYETPIYDLWGTWNTWLRPKPKVGSHPHNTQASKSLKV